MPLSGIHISQQDKFGYKQLHRYTQHNSRSVLEVDNGDCMFTFCFIYVVVVLKPKLTGTERVIVGRIFFKLLNINLLCLFPPLFISY